ncbi:peptidase S24 [Pseudomonas protegens]|nr:peptidase S24 [Pseudomonas protegens]
MFAERLHAALDTKEIRQHGRGADVIKHLESKGISKSAQAVSKWLNGSAIPEIDSLTALAEWLGVRREWLEHGVMPVFPYEAEHRTDEKSVSTAPATANMVPVISWAEAKAWCVRGPGDESLRDRTTLLCPVTISKSGFVLQVIGDSMTNYGPGRSYPPGCLIFVDPEIKAKNGDCVIASLPNAHEATFKVFVEDIGKRFLKSVNPQYPMLEMTEGILVCGKVIGTFIPEH